MQYSWAIGFSVLALFACGEATVAEGDLGVVFESDAAVPSPPSPPLDLSACPAKIDVYFAADSTESTVGAFLMRNLPEPSPYLMRPLRVTASIAGVTLRAEPEGIVQIYRPDGTLLPLPAQLETASETFLLSGVSSGSARLLADCPGVASSTEVRLRVAPMPGLTGEPLETTPFFHYTHVVNVGDSVRTFLDPGLHAERVGLSYDIYVVAHRTAAQWAQDATLLPVNGSPVRASVKDSAADNRLMAWTMADAGEYDVVFDFGAGADSGENLPNGKFDPGDLIGRLRTTADGAELSVLSPPGLPGPQAIASFEYDLPAVLLRAPFDGMSSNYSLRRKGLVVHPQPVPAAAPLVLIVHGNHPPLFVPDPFPSGPLRQVSAALTADESYRGHLYLQNLLASWGYVTVSISEDDAYLAERAGVVPFPAVRFRAWTALKNLEAILSDAAAAGPTLGKIDVAKIHLLGHSRGGEAVLQAYRLLQNAALRPKDAMGMSEQLANSAAWTIATVTSIAPISTTSDTPPMGEVPFLLLWGAADGDVNGSYANVRPAQHYDRSVGPRHYVLLEGVNHNYFNTSWPCSDASHYNTGATLFSASCALLATPVGANLQSTAAVQELAKAYVHAFLRAYAEGQTRYLDYLTRPLSRLRAPAVTAVRSASQYRPSLAAKVALNIDDFETATATNLSSSGGAVAFANLSASEGLYPASTLQNQTRAVFLSWTAATGYYEQGMAALSADLTRHSALAFRAGGTRSDTGGFDAMLSLVDRAGVESSLPLSTLSLVRTSFAKVVNNGGGGFALSLASMATYEFAPTDFLFGGSAINLENVSTIRWRFSFTNNGTLYLDDLNLTNP